MYSDIFLRKNGRAKADLSQRAVKTLVGLFPDIEFIASSVDEFTKAGYCNRHLLPR
ncbi:MAG TPA: hypothetical protein VH396_11325 [Chitinophagaceae bacterium]|jgi:hypothetical protein